MDLMNSFLQRLRPPAAGPRAAPPVPPSEMGPLVTRMWQLVKEAGLPHLSEEEVRQLAVLLDPELRAIANDCVSLLARRPELGEEGLSADWLRGLVLLGLELDTLSGVAEDILGAAGTAAAAFRAALGAFNARVLLAVQERVADPATPLATRQQLLYRFQSALAQDEQRGGKAALREGGGKKLAELRARIAAAKDSQAVLGALRLLRGLLGEDRVRALGGAT